MQAKLIFEQCTPAQVAAATDYAENQDLVTVEIVTPGANAIGFTPYLRFGDRMELETTRFHSAWSEFCCQVTSVIFNT